MDHTHSFGYWLRRRRKALDLTQAELAQRASCSLELIQKIETDARRPSRQMAEKLADMLGIDATERAEFIGAARAQRPVDQLVLPTQPLQRSPHTNLPAQLTALIGREQEVATVAGLLRRADVRLVTLTGPGGVGKTRLGLQVASELTDDFSHGTYFVDMAPIREPKLVTSQIAWTLGVREMHGQSLLATLKEYLGERQLLLLLDNFEQIVKAAPLIAELLGSATGLKMLITSRELLRLRGEKEFVVPPLTLPDSAQLPTAERLSQSAAVALFVERARDARPDFAITNTNAPAISSIAVRLDGLPLAIELAAARLRLFTPEALLARLGNQLALLSGGARDLPARQQTIRNTIEWSYNLLDKDEQVLFARLGVFVGGWTLEAAAEVLSFELRILNKESEQLKTQNLELKTLEGLAALLDKSLIHQRQDVDTTRFSMLETVREYALEQLEASGEAERLRRQHAWYYLSLVEADPFGWFGRTSAERLLPDHDNLRAALAWSQAAGDGAEIGLRLVSGLEAFWTTNGYWSEARGWMAGALARAGGCDPRLHADVLLRLGVLQATSGNFQDAHTNFAASLAICRAAGPDALSAEVLERLGWLAREQGHALEAHAYLEESLQLCRQLGKQHDISSTLNSMAGVAIMQEDSELAAALLEESRDTNRDPVNKYVLSWTLNHFGHVAQLRGEYRRAIELHGESLTLFRQVGDHWIGTAQALHCLGECELGLDDVDGARDHLTAALMLSSELGDRPGVSWCLASLGSAAALDEEPERAARLWGAAERLRQSLGCRPAPATRATYERAIAIARAHLGAGGFAAAWAAGQVLTLDEAIAFALDEGG